MRLKSYLRGLGIGIIVTALLLHYTDTKVDNRAVETKEIATVVENKELEEESLQQTEIEQVEIEKNETEQTEIEQTEVDEQDVISDNEADEVTSYEPVAEEAVEDETSGEEVISNETEETTAETSEEITERLDTISKTLESAAVESSVNSENEVFTLSIIKGDDSGTVARKLFNAGLVDNAAEFDAYLMQHGYDKRISVGTVKIPVGATWNEIAKKISGN